MKNNIPQINQSKEENKDFKEYYCDYLNTVKGRFSCGNVPRQIISYIIFFGQDVMRDPHNIYTAPFFNGFERPHYKYFIPALIPTPVLLIIEWLFFGFGTDLKLVKPAFISLACGLIFNYIMAAVFLFLDVTSDTKEKWKKWRRFYMSPSHVLSRKLIGWKTPKNWSTMSEYEKDSYLDAIQYDTMDKYLGIRHPSGKGNISYQPYEPQVGAPWHDPYRNSDGVAKDRFNEDMYRWAIQEAKRGPLTGSEIATSAETYASALTDKCGDVSKYKAMVDSYSKAYAVSEFMYNRNNSPLRNTTYCRSDMEHAIYAYGENSSQAISAKAEYEASCLFNALSGRY